MIDRDEIASRSEELQVHTSHVQRDYAFGWVLVGIYSASELGKHLVLKGGNCLRKAYFDTTRFSPDLDFVSVRQLDTDFLAGELRKVCAFAQANSGIEFIPDRTSVKAKGSVDPEVQIYEGRIYFRDFFGELSQMVIGIKLDISMLGKIFLPIQARNLIHPYSDQQKCTSEIKCLKLEEMLASKLKCMIQRRHSADLYDFVAAFLLKPVVAVDRGEIVETFLKMTIFRTAPGLVTEFFLELPYQALQTLWDDYLVYPVNAVIEFDQAVESLKASIQAMFGALPTNRGRFEFYPAHMRNTIIDAGRSMTLLKVQYHGVERLIEPYSLKYKTRKDGISREYLYAYDCTGGRSGPGIKAFLHQDVESLENTETIFVPKYEVEISKAGDVSPNRFFPRHPGMRRPDLFRTNPFEIAHVIECPICGKQFRRKTLDRRLHKHKDQYGNDCMGRMGLPVY